MDPFSPVAQLAVAAISGTAFLISMAVIPFPESKADSLSGFTSTSPTNATAIRTVESSTSPLAK
jgi:hypothetical protein